MRRIRNGGLESKSGDISEVNFPDVVTDCREQRRGRIERGSFVIQASRHLILPFINVRKTVGGDRFGLKIIFKELYPNF